MSAPTADLAAVLERLDRLERQNRVLKCLGLVFLCLAGLGVLLAADQPPAKSNILTADRLVVRDAKGKPRIVLTTHKEQSGIIFLSPEGFQQAFLMVEPRGSAFRCMTSDGLYTSGISWERGGIGLIGVTSAGRNLTENNALIVPGNILTRDFRFPLDPEKKK